MNFYMALGLAGLFLVLAFWLDIAQFRRHLASGEAYDANQRFCDLVLMLVPFLALCFPQPFAWNLACCVLLWCLGTGALWLLSGMGYLTPGPALQLAVAPGIGIILVVAYFALYHEGPLAGASLADSAVAAPPEALPPIARDSTHWLIWTYSAAVVLSLLLARVAALAFVGALLLLAALTVLPFFTDHYGWALAAGFVAYAACLYPLSGADAAQNRGASALLMMIAGMLAFPLSLVFYAFAF